MKKKKIIIPVIILTFISTGFLYWHFTASKIELSEAERANAYKQLLGRDIKEEVKIEEKGFQGNYFSLTYPSNLSVKEATSSSEQKSETLRMLGFNPRLNLVVMAVNGEGISLDDYSAVKFRRQSEEWKDTESSSNINNSNTVVFTNKKSPEKTAFLKKNNMIYSISISGSNFSEVEKLFESIAKTITF